MMDGPKVGDKLLHGKPRNLKLWKSVLNLGPSLSGAGCGEVDMIAKDIKACRMGRGDTIINEKTLPASYFQV